MVKIWSLAVLCGATIAAGAMPAQAAYVSTVAGPHGYFGVWVAPNLQSNGYYGPRGPELEPVNVTVKIKPSTGTSRSVVIEDLGVLIGPDLGAGPSACTYDIPFRNATCTLPVIHGVQLDGGPLADRLLVRGTGSSTVSGGGASDIIDTVNSSNHDWILCGDGVDVVRANRLDNVNSECELVTRVD